MNNKQLIWTFGPSLALATVIVALSFVTSRITNMDHGLFVEQLVIATLLVGIVLGAGRTREAGWVRSKGAAWIWLAGPIWLAILTPIGLALSNILETPLAAVVWIASAVLVGLNEETVFRGFLFGGLKDRLGVFGAALLSSLLFGMLHMLNALVGADSEFLQAQMIVAFGTGLVFCAVTLRSGSVWPAVFLHLAGDAIGLSAMGGFGAAIENGDAALGTIVFGGLCAVWGAFWLWRLGRRERLANEVAFAGGA